MELPAKQYQKVHHLKDIFRRNPNARDGRVSMWIVWKEREAGAERRASTSCKHSRWNMEAEESEPANDTRVKPFPYQVAGHLVQGEFSVLANNCYWLIHRIKVQVEYK